MKQSICYPNRMLPENADEFQLIGDHNRFMQCANCCRPFSYLNTHSAAGWRETQISGFCEDCFDALFE